MPMLNTQGSDAKGVFQSLTMTDAAKAPSEERPQNSGKEMTCHVAPQP